MKQKDISKLITLVCNETISVSYVGKVCFVIFFDRVMTKYMIEHIKTNGLYCKKCYYCSATHGQTCPY